MNCRHKNFICTCTVSSVTEDGGDPDVAIHFMVDVVVQCKDCDLPFEFFGMPVGMSFIKPMMGVGGYEARLPIRPSSDPVDEVNVLLK